MQLRGITRRNSCTMPMQRLGVYMRAKLQLFQETKINLAMAKVRATAKDMMGCFVLWSRSLRRRSGQDRRKAAGSEYGSMASQIGVHEAKAISKSICNAFKFAGSKIQSCSSGKKLEPAVWKFVQRLKTLSASSSSPSSCKSLISNVVDLLLRRRWLLRESLSSAHHPRPKIKSLLYMQRAAPMQRAWMPMLP